MSAGGGGDRELRNSRADGSYVLRFSFKFLSIRVKIPESRHPSFPGTQVTQGLTSATEGLGHETNPRGRSRGTQTVPDRPAGPLSPPGLCQGAWQPGRSRWHFRRLPFSISCCLCEDFSGLCSCRLSLPSGEHSRPLAGQSHLPARQERRPSGPPTLRPAPAGGGRAVSQKTLVFREDLKHMWACPLTPATLPGWCLAACGGSPGRGRPVVERPERHELWVFHQPGIPT